MGFEIYKLKTIMENNISDTFCEEMRERITTKQRFCLLYYFATLLQLTEDELNRVSILAYNVDAIARSKGMEPDPSDPTAVACAMSQINMSLEDRKWLLNVFTEALGLDKSNI